MTAAIVVLYHPDQQAVLRLMASLESQVDEIYAVDNTPGSSLPEPAFLRGTSEPLRYIPLGDNMGIAEAQNVAIHACIQAGFSHVLLLDQDSAPCPCMVKRLLAAESKLLSSGKRVAAISPQIIDEKTGKFPCATRYSWYGAKLIYRNGNSSEPIQTDNVMASGSLIRTSILQTLGMMRSDLFIDHVDTEWALRARTSGYNSYGIPNAVLMHSIGDASCKIMGKHIHLHNDIRHFYQLRNEVYLATLKSMGWQWRAYILPRIPYHFVLYCLLSKNKRGAFRILVRSVMDGLLGRLGAISDELMASSV